MKKKLLSFFALAVVGVLAYAATQVIRPTRRATEAVDIVISPAEGDIAAALAAACEGKLAKNITINLTKDAVYTVGAAMAPGTGTFTINGNGATVTAADYLVSLPATPVVEANEAKAGFYEQGAITIDNVKLSTGKAVVKSNAKYLVSAINVTNSLITLTAAVSPFDFGGGAFGYPTELNMKNSTLWASVANNKPYFTSQSGNSPKDINNGAEEKQTISFENCTLYNICSGANFNNLRQRGQKFLVFTVKNNVIVNCGKDNFLNGMDGGQNSTNPTWTVDGNIFGKIKDGVYTDLGESQTGNGEVTNTIAGVVTFTNAAEGDFGGTFATTSDITSVTAGDPRWTITVEKLDVTTLDATIATAEGLLEGKDATVADSPEKTLSDAIAAAKAAKAAAKSQAEVDAANTALETAIEAYKTATGINAISVDGVSGDIFSDGKPVYNLSGQRVFKGYKGVVIKNGKKVVIK